MVQNDEMNFSNVRIALPFHKKKNYELNNNQIKEKRRLCSRNQETFSFRI